MPDSITVKVDERSTEGATPPCSPNSRRTSHSAVTGSCPLFSICHTLMLVLLPPPQQPTTAPPVSVNSSLAGSQCAARLLRVQGVEHRCRGPTNSEGADLKRRTSGPPPLGRILPDKTPQPPRRYRKGCQGNGLCLSRPTHRRLVSGQGEQASVPEAQLGSNAKTSPAGPSQRKRRTGPKKAALCSSSQEGRKVGSTRGS